MKHRILWLAAFGLSLAAPAALADVGLTGNCQDDISALQDEMRDHKDDYTAESRAKANTQMTAAKTNLVNPVKCRKNLVDAHAELRKGKRDKKDK